MRGTICKVNARVHSLSSTPSTKALQSVCLEHGVISAFTSISSGIHTWRMFNTVFCQSGHIQIPSSINSLTGQLGYIRCWSNGTWIRKPHSSMLLSSFDNGSFIIPILRDAALSEVYLIYSKMPLILLTWNWRGAKLSNILEYHTVPLLT